MTNLRSSDDLLARLKGSAGRDTPPEEVQQQRVSFIISSFDDDSSVTREKVQEILDRQDGKKAA